MTKKRDELPWPVAVDDLDGTLHRPAGTRATWCRCSAASPKWTACCPSPDPSARDVRKAAPPMHAMTRVTGLMKHHRGHVPA
ncbi:hypothetical protein ABTX62_02675 [Streptomyces sp. NPDC096046]|uniref:hypothetical protein n=1 Tax=Streptomyces sp. NPDC096046 TaxID=3155542 RepID=UPI00332D2283